MIHYTTLEQGKQLYELGLDPNTANMFYTIFDGNSIAYLTLREMTPEDWARLCPQVYTPCWSTGALLEVCKLFGIKTINISNFTFESLFSTVVKHLKNGKDNNILQTE